MVTDYILFIHGVNTRDKDVYYQAAETMFARIKSSVKDPSRVLEPIYLFWGDIGTVATKSLLAGLKASPGWNQFWFQNLRTEQILPFVGDGALYLSRNISADIVRQITEQALDQIGFTLEDMKTWAGGDRLHLVTHSWGTVILFDVLFAPRWEAEDLDADIRQSVQNIRTGFFGLGSALDRNFGIPISSIHTMGSPIALFNLINLNHGHNFNLTPNLKLLLESLYKKTNNQPLPWRNYAHPGDPIAYPLEGVMPLLLGDDIDKVQTEDIITASNFLMQPFSQSLLPLVNGGKAHGSYWTSQKVANTIAQVISSTGLHHPSSDSVKQQRVASVNI